MSPRLSDLALSVLFALLVTYYVRPASAQPLPVGTFIQDPNSEFIYLSLADPSGFPLYLYNGSLAISNGYSFTGVANILQSLPPHAVYDNVSFTGRFECDQESGGLNVVLLSCSDEGQLCESGWMAEAMGNGPYTFGTGVDQATGRTTFDINGWLSAASSVPYQCSQYAGNPGYAACGASASSCGRASSAAVATSFASTFKGTGGTPSAASGSVTVVLRSAGSLVMVEVPSFTLTTGTSNTALTAQTVLPAGFVPTTTAYISANLALKDTTDTTTLIVAPSISSTGFIQYQLVTAAAAFPDTFATAKALTFPSHTFYYVLA